MDIDDTFSFNAPAEIVFNSLTDPDRIDRWLPVEIEVERRDATSARVAPAAGSTGFDVDTVPEELRLSWRSTGQPALRGSARVEDAPAGGSRVHVMVDVAGSDPSPARVREFLTAAMKGLSRDVSDNFTAG